MYDSYKNVNVSYKYDWSLISSEEAKLLSCNKKYTMPIYTPTYNVCVLIAWYSHQP